MLKRTHILFCMLLLSGAVPANGSILNLSGGAHVGIMPAMGGNLHSASQENFNTYSGVDGINKSMDGYSTETIDRLTGITGGVEIRANFYDFFLARFGFNYTRSAWGGSGKTVYDSTSPTLLKCNYSQQFYDMPLTLGLTIPFWKDVKVSLSCGVAFTYARYENKFKSEFVDIKGNFSGWGFPLVAILEGEYFIYDSLALLANISYYRGATKVLKDGKKSDSNVDFAEIDLTGYRYSFGVTYYFFTL